MIALCIGMLFAACSGRPLEQTEPAVSVAESTEASFSWESPVESETDQPLPNMLYARDKLFVSTGRKAILTCGTADSNITSVTAPNQELSENGQANFGSVGADYVSAAEHAMAMEIDGIYKTTNIKAPETASSDKLNCRVSKAFFMKLYLWNFYFTVSCFFTLPVLLFFRL